ncbi:GNAT family N-acetyltransferase [Polaribacter sp. PL03]|uniref:GNAT family N-acetyltransferase n=1 Tax=Polaribacter sp. PL03 TaxID=3088353 RepID=UPI0029CEF902|nr:GNAT family N-acetyltransferase [Polaribacter sp. PL03]MDX6747666.1 GNAT family N-acetyltransferase [Polaribacter sp. PL03]
MILEVDIESKKDKDLIKIFINSMGNSSNSFRYFNSRPISIIKNHICTILLILDDKPVGYGHLDKEGNNVWFGISIIQEYIGKGQGKLIIDYLIKKAVDLKVPEIKLSVDKENISAIRLYEKYGFVKDCEKMGLLFFIRKGYEEKI